MRNRLQRPEENHTKWRTNRIRVLNGTVAATAFGLPKFDCLIITSCREYHWWLCHLILLLVNSLTTWSADNTLTTITLQKKKPRKGNQVTKCRWFNSYIEMKINPFFFVWWGGCAITYNELSEVTSKSCVKMNFLRKNKMK